jgi:hypothetical protein
MAACSQALAAQVTLTSFTPTATADARQVNLVLTIPSAAPEDIEEVPTDPFACLLLALSVCTNLIEQLESMAFIALFGVEPAGIEPATSCLQSRSDCPLVSRSVAQMPVNAAFLLTARGQERTARDKLVPPWWPLGVRALGRREEGAPRFPGCVSSRTRPRPRPLLRRQSPSARRGAAYLKLIHHVAISAEGEPRVVAELASDVDHRSPLVE